MDEQSARESGAGLWAKAAALKAIAFYRRSVSPMLPPACRFTPSCSHYTYGAIERFGLWRGGWLGFKRICRCNPLCKGGFDPVPEKWPEKLDAEDSEVAQAPAELPAPTAQRPADGAST